MAIKYEWRTWNDDEQCYYGLLPVDEPNNHSLRRIALIYFSNGSYNSSYTHEHGGSRGCHKTIRGAQRWIQRQLTQFCEPPLIINLT